MAMGYDDWRGERAPVEDEPKTATAVKMAEDAIRAATNARAQWARTEALKLALQQASDDIKAGHPTPTVMAGIWAAADNLAEYILSGKHPG